MKAAKEKGEVHKAEEFENGDTLRQLLARSRYLLFKSPDKWTKSQKIRAELLFKQFEDIKHVITTHWSWERSFPQTMTRM